MVPARLARNLSELTAAPPRRGGRVELKWVLGGEAEVRRGLLVEMLNPAGWDDGRPSLRPP